jgi:hypothetical protein
VKLTEIMKIVGKAYEEKAQVQVDWASLYDTRTGRVNSCEVREQAGDPLADFLVQEVAAVYDRNAPPDEQLLQINSCMERAAKELAYISEQLWEHVDRVTDEPAKSKKR